MGGTIRSRAQKLKDREEIARLRLRCKTIASIAESLGLSSRTIIRELKSIEAEWRDAAKEDIAAVKARELRKLDDLEAEARAEWERSKKDFQKRVVEDKPGRRAGQTTRAAKIETQGQTGDPRYLTVILSIHERRSKLLGADAPTKIAPTNPDGTEPFRAMSDEELDRRIAELAAKAGAPA